MNRRFAGFLVAALATVLLSATVQAQPRREGTIAACGVEAVRVQPTLLRLEVQLQTSGATAEKAVEQLKARRTARIAKLKDLKAEEGSIHFTNTVLTRNAILGSVPSPCYPPPAGTAPFLPGGFAPPTVVPPAELAPPTLVPQSAPEPPPILLPSAAPSSSSDPSETTRPVVEATPPTGTPPAGTPPATTPALTPAIPRPVELSAPPPRTTFAPALTPAVPNPGGLSTPAAPPTLPMLKPVAPATPTPLEPPSGDSVPTPSDGGFSATTTLRAEWRLTASDPDGIALAGEALREKLVAAGIFGVSHSRSPCLVPTTTPYGMPADTTVYTYTTVANGGFTLSFVGTLSDARRKAALTVATNKARQRAAELADIAGGRLGDLWSVESDIHHPTTGDRPFDTNDVISFPRADQPEVVFQSPDLPEFTVRVTLTYRFVSKNATNP